MLWAGLALLGAVLDAGYYALAKRFLASVEDEVLAAGGFLAASALLFLVSFARGIPVVSSTLLLPVAITGTINIIAALLVFRALRRTDLSLAVPMITFTLVFLMGSSYLVLGELPTAAGIAGILLIVAGALVMQVPAGGESRDPTAPDDPTSKGPAPSPVILRLLQRMAGDRGILLMLLVAF
ncbi:MAG: DMT family transporter, partial [Methanomicrobiales archaeon]|nr:DMT family transporter [Methanomicrobiales archaeon]